jgi:hypothetical protein
MGLFPGPVLLNRIFKELDQETEQLAWDLVTWEDRITVQGH